MLVPQEFAELFAAIEGEDLGATDEPGLTDSVRRLGAAALQVVPSCQALSVTVHPLGRACTVLLDQHVANTPVVSSLRLTILIDGTQVDGQRADGQQADGQHVADLVMYATAPRAFDKMFAGLQRDDLVRAAPRLDQDLALPEGADDLAAQLDDLTAIGRATGVLLDRGSSPEQAQLALEDQATRRGVELAAAAREVLAQVTHTPHS